MAMRHGMYTAKSRFRSISALAVTASQNWKMVMVRCG